MIIDGKKIAAELISEIKNEVSLIQKKGFKLKLSVILIGDFLPSQIYVKNKQKKLER